MLVVALMVFFILIGVPVAFALGLSSLAFFVVNDISLGTFAQKMAESVNSFSLLALPFYILAGNLMNNGGITKRLFKLADDILGSIRGGLCYVSIVSGALFSAMSGSAIANAAGLGTIQIQAMKERGYDEKFCAGLISAVSVLGPIIPPSMIMIVYAVSAGTSVQSMFLGGMVPGVLLCLMYALLCAYYGKKLNFPRGERFNLKRAANSFVKAFGSLMAPVIILGGIFTGIFTATESGAIACLYSIIAGFIYGDLKPGNVAKILLKSARDTGAILFVSATGTLFGFCLSYARVPAMLAVWMAEFVSSKAMLMLLLSVVYLILGCLMTPTAIVITTVPIFVPICKALGVDLVYFGVLVGILMSIGTITPPVGNVMFIICRNTGLSVEQFTKTIMPWYFVIAVFLFVLIFVPQTVTFLPSLFV